MAMVTMTSKVKSEKGSSTGSLARDNTEHQRPPTVYLEHHHLEKLGLTKMPAVGSKIHIHGLAHVGATSENQETPPSGGKAPGKEGSTKRSMTLHFHKMEIGRDNSEVDQDAEKAKGAKAEMDKALKREEGGKKSTESEGEEDGGGDVPRGGED
jgi:hypothetical protein